MNEPVAIYPWLIDWRVVAEILLGGALAVAVLYLWLRAGRDRPNEPPTPYKEPMHTYAGMIQASANKVPVFTIVFIVVITLWALAYIVKVAMQGGLDY